MSHEPIVSAEVLVNGDLLQFWYVAYSYPTSLLAGRAWEQTDKRSQGEALSVFRMLAPEDDQWFVIAIGEKIESVRKANRVLAVHGQAITLDDDLVMKLIMRRARAVTESGGEQVARYGRPGMELDELGRLRQWKDPDSQ